MNGYQWFTIAQTIVMALAAGGVALLYRGFQTGKWVQDQESRAKEIAEIDRRLERAGRQMSDLASDIQGLPERFHREYIPRETYLVELAVIRERHKEFRDEWAKEQNTIWAAIRDLQSRRRNG